MKLDSGFRRNDDKLYGLLVSSPFLHRVGGYHAFLEDKAAVEPALAGLHHAVSLFGETIKGVTLYRAHRPGTAFRRVDLTLNLGLHARQLVGLVHDFHAYRRLVDEGVERHDRQYGASRAGSGNTIQPDEAAQHGMARDRIGGEIRVADDKIIAMAHGAKRVEQIGGEDGIKRFEHEPRLSFNSAVFQWRCRRDAR